MLTTNSLLGPYRIVELIGAGGMGEVYRAHDPRLGRDVAIKVLGRHLAATPDVRARFEREARTVSQLNHPHIATLHDIGHEAGIDYLVMELLDGDTLADRLAQGPLPVTEFLAIGAQIVGALAAAHRAGVIHRDLKPGNIMLTPTGAKLLDFGLARPADPGLPDAGSSQSPTVGTPLTMRGAVVGTLQYMAPEQLEGQDVDARADVFSLGCVLYEMATGVRAFAGETSLSIMGSILHRSPARTSSLNAALPTAVERLIERCLEKDPARRPADATVVAAELAGLTNWVRYEALPKLAEIAGRVTMVEEGPDGWEGFLLAREIEKLAPGDPQLERLWPEFTRPATFVTEPPGAVVAVQFYGTPDADWIPLGTTPVTVERLPRGILRIRIERTGYRPLEDILWNMEADISGATDAAASLWQYQLRRPGEIPDGMEEVPAGRFPLFMPGLDHLEAEPTGGYLIDRHPVTNREYRAFVEAGGYGRTEWWCHPFLTASGVMTHEAAMAAFRDSVGAPGPASWEFGEYPAGEDELPVTGISWYEAAAYAAWRDGALPTIFHWNRVAFTVASSQIIPISNFSGMSLLPVGSSRSVNRFGVHDLAGNVREWSFNGCDRVGERFVLGGAWCDAEYTFTDACTRDAFERSASTGFRCIRPTEVDANEERLGRLIDLPFRDFRAETPVSDEVFGFFLRQFHYDRVPLNAVVESEETGPMARCLTIHFDAAYGGERMTAYLYLPLRGRPPYQTVIIFPGSFAIHTSQFSDYEIRRADFLLKNGRAVLIPIYKGTYSRGDDFKSDYPDESTFYKDHVVMWSKDLARSIDYLATRDDIDIDRLAYYGLSWGGALGAILPAVEKRLAVVILYVAGLTFQRALPEADQINYVTRVVQPTLMLNGEHDFFFPLETSQRPMFDLLGTPPEHKRQIVYPRGHSVPRTEVVKEVLAWLDRYLGPAG